MSVRVGCPYCNRRVVLPAVPDGGKAACDRCGETFTVTGEVEQVPDPGPPEPTTTRPAAGMGVGLWLAALLPAAVGLGIAGWLLLTPTPPPAPVATPPAAGPITWPPPAVPLLRHLPTDTGLAFVVQPGPLLAHAERTATDPRKLLADLGLPDRVFATLADLGLPFDRIDQLAGGLTFPADSAVPRAVVAVRPKPPATVAGVLDALKAGRMGVRDGRPSYQATVAGVPVLLADADGVLVAATTEDGLDQPQRPPGGGHLPAGLRETLTHLNPAAFAWVATDAADWADTPTAKFLALSRPGLADRLKLGRAAGAGLAPDGERGLRAGVAVRAAGDEKGLQERLAAAVAGKEVLVGGGDGWVTLSAKPEDVAGLAGR